MPKSNRSFSVDVFPKKVWLIRLEKCRQTPVHCSVEMYGSSWFEAICVIELISLWHRLACNIQGHTSTRAGGMRPFKMRLQVLDVQDMPRTGLWLLEPWNKLRCLLVLVAWLCELRRAKPQLSEKIQFGKFHRQTEFKLAVKLVSCVEIPVVDLKKEVQSSMTPKMRLRRD